jgi:hypothetical protein
VYVGSDGGDAAGDMVVYAGQLLGVAALHGERSVEACRSDAARAGSC